MGKNFFKKPDEWERSAVIVPKELETFVKTFEGKLAAGSLLGENVLLPESTQRAGFTQTLKMAKLNYAMFKDKEKEADPLEPNEAANRRTQMATNDFFHFSYQLLNQTGKQFPLAGLNKCLGMVAVPHSKLVMVAISQDKNPILDEPLRKNMVAFLEELNAFNSEWRYELARIPTKAQYLMPRTFFMRIPHQAPLEWVEPPTRCVEVALMVALCKIGRSIKFNPSEVAVIAYSATLWAEPEGTVVVSGFQPMPRNKKYSSSPAVAVKLSDSLSGWIDTWDPCTQHCAIYKKQMLAIAASGGPATSFMEPRSESLLFMD